MFFTDDNGIQSCALGTGDVVVSEGKLKGIPHSEWVCILFSEGTKGEIGKDFPELEGKEDHEIDTKIKLQFSNTKSINVVVRMLEKAKSLMEQGT